MKYKHVYDIITERYFFKKSILSTLTFVIIFGNLGYEAEFEAILEVKKLDDFKVATRRLYPLDTPTKLQ